jgi:23S rRNA pseudouridine1911/1915/1917 synthase
MTAARGQPGAVAARFVVDGNEARLRVDQFLCQRIERLSRTRIRSFIERGDVELRGALARANQRVHAADEVLVWRIPPPEPEPMGWPVEIARGDDWVALNKPGDLTVHPTARYHHNTVTAWLERSPERYPDARLVHRLDRETSGVLLIALGPAADRRLKKLVMARAMKKTYLAVVEGQLVAAQSCDGAIGDQVPQGIIRLKQTVCAQGQPALTRFEPVVNLPGGRSLVRCFPTTGRMHQLRVHLSHVGHPIVGDKIYGSAPDIAYDRFVEDGLNPSLERIFGGPRQLLHASELHMELNPGEPTTLRAPLPEDFVRAGVPRALE